MDGSEWPASSATENASHPARGIRFTHVWRSAWSEYLTFSFRLSVQNLQFVASGVHGCPSVFRKIGPVGWAAANPLQISAAFSVLPH